MSGLTFIDARGLAALQAFNGICERGDRGLQFIPAPPATRLIKLCGVEQMFDIVAQPSAADASRDSQGPPHMVARCARPT